MNFDPPTLIAAIVPSILALVWILRLEGRINTNESEIRGLRVDVTYIRDRIDDAISSEGYSHRRKEDSR